MTASVRAGHPFLSLGFRPFFLAASIYAAAGMALWVVALAGEGDVPSVMAPSLWHGHEMVFGYVAAVIGGFLLTAVPNWTGRAPLSGRPLGLLVLLWVAGRFALWLQDVVPGPLVAALDLAFLPALGLAVARPLVAARKPHNLVFLALLGVLTVGNALVHAEALGLVPDAGAAGLRLAVDTVVLMIAMIGGRVVPAFTANALAARGDGDKVTRSATLDRAAVLATVLFVATDVGWPGTIGAGAVAVGAAAVHAARLAGWRTRDTLGTPILWVLHLGYLWLAVGLGLKGLAGLTDLLPGPMSAHGLTTGAFGTMTMAIMSRAALGHTGRALVAAPLTVAAFGLISLAALARIAFAPWWPDANLVAGALWTMAFGLFAASHAGMLIGPRADAR